MSVACQIRAFDPLEPSLAADPATQLTRVFVYFLQNLFRTFPEGRGLRWRPEQETTEIVITSEKPVQDAPEKVPHIVVALGAQRWAGLGIDQLQRAVPSRAERVHTDLVSANMTYNCLAKEGLVARRIAWNCSFYTNALRRLLIRGGGLHHVGVNHEISAESPAGTLNGGLATDEVISVMVTVPFHWQPQWLIREPAEVLKGMSLTLGARRPTVLPLGKVATSLPAVKLTQKVQVPARK